MEINRRQFLIKTSSSLAAGWALTNGILRPDSAAAEEVNSIPFATPVFLMKYSPKVKLSDYRGKTVVLAFFFQVRTPG